MIEEGLKKKKKKGGWRKEEGGKRGDGCKASQGKGGEEIVSGVSCF